MFSPPISIFGHADPVGDDEYNKRLSGRRATAIYALLTRKTKLWEELYSQLYGRDNWGLAAIQTMLRALGRDPGPITSSLNTETREIVKAFQQEQGLRPDGDPGPKTRKTLFLAYMDQLCGKDFVLDPHKDFLARGQDPGGKGDYQGCGVFPQ